jgi:hypothetical protein
MLLPTLDWIRFNRIKNIRACSMELIQGNGNHCIILKYFKTHWRYANTDDMILKDTHWLQIKKNGANYSTGPYWLPLEQQKAGSQQAKVELHWKC